MNSLKKKAKTESSLAKGCDGILLLEHKDEWYLCLIELKSGFMKLAYATEQLEITYCKFLMLLEIVEGIDISKFKLIGFLISNLPDAEQKSKILKKSKACKGYCIEKLFERLLIFGKVTKKEENSILNNFPIKDKFKFNKMHIHYIKASTKSVNILDYLPVSD